ncbi:MAG TPA: GNAT family N-acetyltransferase [Kiloniellales bacterium]|nr:GNAT family N-acetyltransferase [Kiloniellales bacterium]
MSQGFTLREAAFGDAEAIARVHVETWRAAYAGVVPDHYLIGMSVQGQAFQWKRLLRRPAERHMTLVAEVPRAGVVGFGSAGTGRSRPPPASGEIYTLYVATDWQGRGIGRALLNALLGRLAGLGHADAYLWVLADNPSRFFYERVGGQRVAQQVESFAGSQLQEYAYRWPTRPQR